MLLRAPDDAVWAVEDVVGGGLAKVADMWERTGTYSRLWSRVELKADRSISRWQSWGICTGTVGVAVVGAGAEKTEWLRKTGECNCPKFQVNLVSADSCMRPCGKNFRRTQGVLSPIIWWLCYLWSAILTAHGIFFFIYCYTLIIFTIHILTYINYNSKTNHSLYLQYFINLHYITILVPSLYSYILPKSSIKDSSVLKT